MGYVGYYLNGCGWSQKGASYTLDRNDLQKTKCLKVLMHLPCLTTETSAMSLVYDAFNYNSFHSSENLFSMS